MKKNFEQFAMGTAARVVAHAAYKASRGCGPSMQFLTERNPGKALIVAKSFLAQQRARQKIDEAIMSCGEILLTLPKRVPYRNMSRVAVEMALRHIIISSSTEEEIEQRATQELGCPNKPCINVLRNLSRLGQEAKELCTALGGACMKTGEIVQVMIWGPDDQVIMI